VAIDVNVSGVSRDERKREMAFANRDCDIELVEREGEVLFGRAAYKGDGSSLRASLGRVRSATAQAFSRI